MNPLVQWAFLSDPHLGYMQYGIRRRQEDFAHALKAAVRAALDQGLRHIVCGGDTLHQSRPDSCVLQTLHEINEMLLEADAWFYTIHGNHDLCHPPWCEQIIRPCDRNQELRIRIVDNQVFTIDGVKFLGVPSMGVEAFRKIVWEDIDAEMLIVHQLVNEWLPFAIPGALDLKDLPTKQFRMIMMGDLHKCDFREVDGCVVGYPGSTEMNKDDEPEDKFWHRVTYDRQSGKIELDAQRIPSRVFLKYTFNDYETLPDGLNAIEEAWNRLRGDDPREGVLLVRYPMHLTELQARIVARFNPERWILRWKPIPVPAGETLSVNENEPEEASLSTEEIFRSRLTTLRPDLTPLALALLKPEANSEALLTQYVEQRLHEPATQPG